METKREKMPHFANSESKQANDYLQTRVRHPRDVPPNFALYCDWFIWNDNYSFIDLSKKPKTVYVRSEIKWLNYFTDQLLPHLQNKFILVTSSHDTTMPLGFAKKFNFDWKKIFNNKYLVSWFTENRDYIHPKIHPLTLGLPHPDSPSWLDSKNKKSIWTASLFKNRMQWIKQPKLQKIFGCWYSRVNHPSGTCLENEDERTLAYDWFIKKKTIFDWYPPGLERIDFLKKLGEYQFTLCPHGGGLDPNPRCWESLLMKTIPIVKRNSTSCALLNLPIVIVDDWSEVTEENLLIWKESLSEQLYDKDLKFKMSNEHFYNKIIENLQNQ